MTAPMNAAQVLEMSARIVALHVRGATNTGPLTVASVPGIGVTAPAPLTVEEVLFARRWALESDMAADAHRTAANDGPASSMPVPIVLPDGSVVRARADTLNAAALTAAQVTAAAELTVFLNVMRATIARVAALERLRDAVAQVEALDDGGGEA